VNYIYEKIHNNYIRILIIGKFDFTYEFYLRICYLGKKKSVGKLPVDPNS